MARRKIEDRTTRSLNRLAGGSYTITLPIEYVRELKWREGQKLTVEYNTRTSSLSVKDWRSPRQKRKK
jgi:hypothetical protein